MLNPGDGTSSDCDHQGVEPERLTVGEMDLALRGIDCGQRAGHEVAGDSGQQVGERVALCVAEREGLGHRQRGDDQLVAGAHQGQRDPVCGEVAQRQQHFGGGDAAAGDDHSQRL